jgi:hypothetical protein
MHTTPSSVDLNHQEEILNMLGDDDFYIFMIWNKSFTSTNKVYDLKKNILFEDRDITVKIVGGVEDFETFIKGAKSMVQNRAVVTNTAYSGYNGYSGGAQSSKPSGTSYNPISTSKGSEKDVAKDNKKDDKKDKPRTKVDGSVVKNSGQRSILDMYDDDPYGSYYRGY